MTVDASNSRAKTHCAKGGFPDLQAGLLDLANLASQKGLRERGQRAREHVVGEVQTLEVQVFMVYFSEGMSWI